MTNHDDLAELRTHPDYDVDEMRTVHAPPPPPARAPYPEARSLALQVADLYQSPDTPPDAADPWPSTANLDVTQATLTQMITWLDIRLATLAAMPEQPHLADMAQHHRTQRAILEPARHLLQSELTALRLAGGN